MVFGGLILVSLSACDSSSRPIGASVRDSLGIAIVDHGALDVGGLPVWSLEAEPILRIGVVDGDDAYQFYDVIDAHRRRDGSIAVLDRSRAVRVFDSLGAHVWTAGGEGDGPGEFRYPQMVTEISGDSLVVWDIRASRLSFFTPDGTWARMRTVSELAGSTRYLGKAGPDLLLIDHRTYERGPISGHEALTHQSEPVLLDVRGAGLRRLDRRFLAREFEEVESQDAFGPAIFDVPAVFAAASDGVWYGDTKDYELRLSTAEGLQVVLRWEGVDRTITEADFDPVLRLWSGGPDVTPEFRQMIRRYGQTHPRAEQFPAYAELRADVLGRLWVRDFVWGHEDDGLRSWTIFSSDGTQMLGRRSHADAFRPLQIGADWIVGVERDDLDVEQIVLRAIAR
jgi:hypothetical protein